MYSMLFNITEGLAMTCGMLLLFWFVQPILAQEPALSLSAETVECYDVIEFSWRVQQPVVKNPFTEVEVYAVVQPDQQKQVRVEGFADAADGSLFRVRFMPRQPGLHQATVTYAQGGTLVNRKVSFTAVKSQRKGPVRVDPQFPAHFLREGTGEHWFWNGTTTYQLLAWSDEAIITQSIDRLARLGINRLRCTLCCRTPGGKRWNEPLVNITRQFPFKLEPWVAARPENLADPGYDVTRFNLPFFQKVERMVRHAREKGVMISIIFYLDAQDPGVEPFGGKKNLGNPDEDRYYRYVISRLATYENVMWDITNEWHLFRTQAWVNRMGDLIKQHDPYQHLTSVHGDGTFPYRRSPWADFALYQSWDEHGSYGFMMKNRQLQRDTGKVMPQINEEYGYEDHYPTPWGGNRVWPTRIADNRRRLAWEISMAGCYQTTGERANDGTGAGPDTGGGWVNGRGNDAMTMLTGYRYMKDFFTSMPWWRLEPQTKSADGTLILAEKDIRYVTYQPRGGMHSLELPAGNYQVKWYNPRSGQWSKAVAVQHPGGMWRSPEPADAADWGLVIEKQQ